MNRHCPEFGETISHGSPRTNHLVMIDKMHSSFFEFLVNWLLKYILWQMHNMNGINAIAYDTGNRNENVVTK